MEAQKTELKYVQEASEVKDHGTWIGVEVVKEDSLRVMFEGHFEGSGEVNKVVWEARGVGIKYGEDHMNS